MTEVNIYDDINRLEASLRQTKEFQDLIQAIDEVSSDEEATKKMKDFREMQEIFQTKQIRGEKIDEETLVRAEQASELAQGDPKVLNMMEAEVRLSNLLEEITRVITSPIQKLYEKLN